MKLKLIPLCAILAILATSCVTESQKQALIKQGYDSGARFVRDSLKNIAQNFDPFKVPPTHPPDDGHVHNDKRTRGGNGLTGTLAYIEKGIHPAKPKAFYTFVNNLEAPIDITEDDSHTAGHKNHYGYELIEVFEYNPDGSEKGSMWIAVNLKKK